MKLISHIKSAIKTFNTSGIAGDIVSLVILMTVSILIYSLLLTQNLVKYGVDLRSHYHWVDQFKTALLEGYWYPRWMPLDHFGLGGHTFYLIHPVYYYFTSGISILFGNTWLAIKISAVIANLATGILIWVITKRDATKSVALIAAIFSQLMPWQFFLFNLHEAFPASFSIPLLIALVDTSLARNKPRYAPLAVIAALTIMTHVLTAFMGFICIGICKTIELARSSDPQKYRFFGTWILGILAGCLLSSVYLLPAMSANYLFDQSINNTEEYIKYLNWKNSFAFPAITSRLFGTRWSSVQWIYPVINLTILLTVYVYAKAQKPDKGTLTRLKNLLWFSFAGIFLSSELAYPLYATIGLLQKVQWPYRYNIVSSVGIVLILPLLFKIKPIPSKAFKQKLITLCVFLAYGTSVALFAALMVQVKKEGQTVTDDALSHEKGFGQSTAMPTWVGKDWKDYVNNGGFTGECARKQIECKTLVSKSQDRAWLIRSNSPTTVNLPIFFMPTWSGKVNDMKLEIAPDKNTGLISIQVPQGDNIVEINWKGLAIERTGLAVSLITLLVISMTWRFGTRKCDVE